MLCAQSCVAWWRASTAECLSAWHAHGGGVGSWLLFEGRCKSLPPGSAYVIGISIYDDASRSLRCGCCVSGQVHDLLVPPQKNFLLSGGDSGVIKVCKAQDHASRRGAR